MQIRSHAKNLPKDPYAPGSVLGWAVVRTAPQSFIDIFAFKGIAETQAARLGTAYSVKYGSHRLGTDDFIEASTAST
ncbi:MAG: hypothetical protein ABIO21_09885 [Pseudomonas sp.]